MIGPASVQGYIEKSGVVHRSWERMSRELVGEIIAVPRIFRKRFRHRCLGLSAEIRIGSVEIIDTVPDGKVEHGIDLLLIYLTGSRIGREPHASETQAGQFGSVKIAVDHGYNLR